MNFPPQHEIHRRRFSRNLGLGLTLAAFVGLVFALTVVKVTYEPHSEPAAQTIEGGSP